MRLPRQRRVARAYLDSIGATDLIEILGLTAVGAATIGGKLLCPACGRPPTPGRGTCRRAPCKRTRKGEK